MRLFIQDITAALNTAKAVHVGGVHINETCSARADLMPYGGVKASGFGQEGLDISAPTMRAAARRRADPAKRFAP